MAESVNISADEISINDILTRDHRFEVPNYQRQYSWTESQWEDLWNDLQSISSDQTHFLGSVVVVSEVYEPTGSNLLQIVDGQQRLTTISILLCSLRQRYSEIGKENDSETLDMKYLWRTGFEEPKPRITLGNLDNGDYLEILNGNPDRVKKNQLLADSYWYFYSKLSDADEETLNQIRKKILKNLSVVMITSGSEGSAFRLFETLNDRGLDLSAIDLMKNHLLRIAHESNEDEVEIKAGWEHVVDTLRESEDRIRFFRHYLMSLPEPRINGRITASKVYDSFKDLITYALSPDGSGIEKYVRDMEEISQLYIRIENSNVDYFYRSKNEDINTKLQNLDDIGATPTRILLLRCFRETNNPDTVLSIIDLVERFMLRCNIARYSSSSMIDKTFNRLAHNAFDDPNPVDYIQRVLADNAPSDDEFVTQFKERNHQLNSQTKYILDTLEQRYFVESGEGKQIGGRMQVHIEHIAPQRAANADKYSKWLDYLDIDKQTFLQYRNRIGNLTLYERRLNEKASDKPFEQKKAQYQNSDFQMTRELREYEEWSISAITERSERLADIAVSVWSI